MVVSAIDDDEWLEPLLLTVKIVSV